MTAVPLMARPSALRPPVGAYHRHRDPLTVRLSHGRRPVPLMVRLSYHERTADAPNYQIRP
jgi:hypothetical protein